MSPYAAEGAALVELVGTPGNVLGPELSEVLTYSRGDTVWVFVALRQAGLIRFTLEVAKGSPAPAARVLQVADGANQLRTQLEDYAVRVNR